MGSPCAATLGASVLTGGTDIKRMNSSRVEYMTIMNALIKKKTGWRRRAGKAPLPVEGQGGRHVKRWAWQEGLPREKAAIGQPSVREGNRLFPCGLQTKPPRWHLALRLAVSRMGRKQRPMVKAPCLWCFIMAA